MKLLARPRVSLCGPSALLFESDGPLSLPVQQRIWSLIDIVREWNGVCDVQPGMNNLLVLIDPVALDAEALGERLLKAWPNVRPLDRTPKVLEIGVLYGGESAMDMRELAASHGLSPLDVARLHAGPDYTVFAPGTGAGYGYLFGLDARLVTPRKKVPVTRPSGSYVSIGGAQTGIGTPTTTKPPEMAPNGWHVIGYAPDAPMPFDLSKEQPFLLSLGDKVRFRIERVES